jgi:hypothetical protein
VQRCEELRRVSPSAIPPHFPAETMKDSRQSVESGSQKLQDAVVVSVVAVPGRVIDASPALITGPWSIDACSVRGKEAFASAADEPSLQQNQRCRRSWLTSCGCCPAARWPSCSRWCRPAGYPRGRPQPTSLNGLPRFGRGSSVTLAGTIISIVPIPLANRVIIEFHAVNDMVTEPDTDIGVRLYVARH